MFCPNCSSYLTEVKLMKTNVRYMPGTIQPVEYDARCPACMMEIGRMSWGQLTVNPDLEKMRAEAPEPAQNAEAAAEPEQAQPNEQPSEPEEAGKICPHCGKALPKDF